MNNEEILNRIEEIIRISKEKQANPPVELVYSFDGHYILKDLYEEYVKLIDLKKNKKIVSNIEKSKLDQLTYIKDKMEFLKNKAINSDNKISILEEDMEEYLECLKLSNELSSELLDVLNNKEQEIEQDNENPEESIEKTVQLPIINLNKITLEEDTISNKREENKTKEEDTKIDSNRLLQDLADIDKILGSLTYGGNIEREEIVEKQDFKIGDIVYPIKDINSYNDENIKAIKDNYYKIISFVSIDNSEKVVDSNNELKTSYNDYISTKQDLINLIVIASMPDENVTFEEWKERDISTDNKNCVGSFEVINNFIAVNY